MWATQGQMVNPAAGTVLADTGPIGGLSSYTIIIATTAQVITIIAHRNATNTADVISQVIPAQTGLTPPMVFPIDVVPGGRVVVRLGISALVGTIQAAILRD